MIARPPILTLQGLRRRAHRIQWEGTEETLARALAEGKTAAGPVLFIEVWGCKAALVLAELAEGRIRTTPVSGIENALLETAVFAAGGSLLIAGRYPIDDDLRLTLTQEAP